jgi:hypothetical protein
MGLDLLGHRQDFPSIKPCGQEQMSEGAILIPLNSIRLVDYLMIYTLVHQLHLCMYLNLGPDCKLMPKDSLSYSNIPRIGGSDTGVSIRRGRSRSSTIPSRSRHSASCQNSKACSFTPCKCASLAFLLYPNTTSAHSFPQSSIRQHVSLSLILFT